jgi:hypothetical protein
MLHDATSSCTAAALVLSLHQDVLCSATSTPPAAFCDSQPLFWLADACIIFRIHLMPRGRFRTDWHMDEFRAGGPSNIWIWIATFPTITPLWEASERMFWKLFMLVMTCATWAKMGKIGSLLENFGQPYTACTLFKQDENGSVQRETAWILASRIFAWICCPLTRCKTGKQYFFPAIRQIHLPVHYLLGNQQTTNICLIES